MVIKNGTIPYVRHGFLLVCCSNFVPKMRVFQIFDFQHAVTLKTGLGVLTSPFDRVYMTFNYRSIAAMGLSRTVIEIDCDFRRKSQISHLLCFAPPLKEFPWNWDSAHGVKKLEWLGYKTKQEVWRYLQSSGYNPPTWQTDGRTDGRTPGTAKTALTHSVER